MTRKLFEKGRNSTFYNQFSKEFLIYFVPDKSVLSYINKEI
jgi:hypothetical protein